MRATCPPHMIILNLIVLITLGEYYKFRSTSLRSLPPINTFFLGSYIFLINLFSDILSLYYTLNARAQFSHPYKTVGKHNSSATEYVLMPQANITWLMFLESSVPLDELFRDIHIPFDCEFLVAQQSGDISLTEVYRIQRYQPLQTYRVSDWSSEGGFVWTDAPFYKRRGDLKGLRLRGSIYPQVP
jgi:hypothetical protein